MISHRNYWQRLVRHFVTRGIQSHRSRPVRRRGTIARKPAYAAAIESLETRVLLTAGSLDTTFDGDGKLTTSFVDPGALDERPVATLELADGKLLSVGNQTGSNRGNVPALARYNANGSLDTTFGNSGRLVLTALAGSDGRVDFTVNTAAVQADGKLVLAGQGATGGNFLGGDAAIVRLNADGSLDTAFGTGGVAVAAFTTNGGEFNAVQVVGGKIVAAGFTYDAGFDSLVAAARFNADGTLDASFNGGGEQVIDLAGTQEEANALAVQADGKLVLAGSVYTNNTRGNDLATLRLNTDGTLDSSFGTAGVSTIDLGQGSEFARSVNLQASGKIVLVGERDFSATAVRLNANGTLDTSFGTAGRTEIPNANAGYPAAGTLQSDGKILVGTTGYDDFFNVVFLASRLTVDGALDTSFDTDGVRTIDVPGDANTEVLNAIAVRADGRILLTGSTRTDATRDDFALVSLTTAGARDFPFANNGIVVTGGFINSGRTVSEARDSVRLADGKLLVVGSTSVDSVGRATSLVRYNVDGSLDATFGSGGRVLVTNAALVNASFDVQALSVLADGRILLAGDAFNASGNQGFAATRLNADGTLDTTFGISGLRLVLVGSNGSDLLSGLGVQSDGKIVLGGTVDPFSGNSRVAAIRLTANGALDNSFGTSGKAVLNIVGTSETVNAVTLLADDRILLVGSTNQAGTQTDFAVTRLTAGGALDTTFGVGGTRTVDIGGNGTDIAYAVALDAAGNILLAGNGYDGNANGESGFAIARLSGDGTLDTTFAGDGTTEVVVSPNFFSGDAARGIAIDPAGRIIVAGDGLNNNFAGLFAVARLTTAGILDTSYGNNGIQRVQFRADQNEFLADLELDPDGKAILVGTANQPDGFSRFAVARLFGESDVRVDNATVTVGEGSNATNTGRLVNFDPALTTLTASAGSVTLNTDGTFTFILPNAREPQDSQTITLTATSTTDFDTTTFGIVVTNVAPVAMNDSITLDEDTTGSGNVLTNDSDAGSDPLTAVLVTGPTNGTLVLNANGSFTYTPAANFNGTDSFTYRANDGTDNSNLATVTLNVTPVNDLPTATGTTVTTDEDVPANGAITAADVDGDTLTYSVSTAPANGTVTLGANGNFTYTPAANFNGTDSFVITVSDGNGGTATANVSVTVNAVNDAPVAGNSSLNTAEDTPGNGTVTATDVENDPLTYSVVTGPINGTLVFNSDGTFTYTPNANFNGSDSFTYRANDGSDDSNAATVSITVTAVNDAPTATGTTVSTDEDTAANGAITAADVDDDTLTYSVTTAPNNGTVTLGANGNFTYTPAANFNGGDSFVITVNDGNGGTATAAVSVTINAVNDAPVAQASMLTTLEGSAGSGTVTATDVENDPLTFSVVGGPAHGSLVFNNDGTYTYTPDTDYSGPDNFTFRANDGSDDSNAATVSITVTPLNDPPVAQPGSLTTNEDVSASGAVTATDTEGDPLTYSLVSGPTNGTLVFNANGTFSYTPDANYFGSDSFTYRANDGTSNSNTATVSITINSINDAPVAANGSLTTDEDTPGSGTVNASDVENDPLTYSVVTGPTNGTLVFNADGTYSYTPDANYNGSDSFTYQANDGTDDSNIATVSITVVSVNDAPVAANGSLNTVEDTAATGAVVASDVEGDPLTYSLVSGPTNGTLIFNTDGTFSYTPDANYFGSDSFTYRANDGTSNSNTATVSITINSINDAPVAANGSLTTDEDTPGSGTVNASDVENDPLTYSVVTGPTNGTLVFNADGTYSYTPDANYNGSDSFTYQANDGTDDSNIATVSITVVSVNDAPVAANGSLNTVEDTAATGAVVASDVEGDPLTYSLVSGPTNGTLVFNANGTFSYMPDANFTGSDSFTYQANDGTSDSNVATVSIDVALADLQVFVSSVSVVEGTGGSGSLLTFRIRLDRPADGTVTVQYTTLDGTAVAGSDYAATSGEITFAPGEMVKFVQVLVNGDRTTERNEGLFLQLSDLQTTGTRGISAGGLTGFGRILDDDAAKVFVSDAVVIEGNPGGMQELVFTVRLDHAVDGPVVLRYTAEGWTAVAGEDFRNLTGVLRFEPGETVKTVRIRVQGDRLTERDELMRLVLSDLGASGRDVTLDRTSGTGKIVNDDATKVFVSDASVTEGNPGDTQELVFTVRLDHLVDGPVVLRYTAEGWTAVAGEDFRNLTGVLRFESGETVKTVRIRVQGDRQTERDELMRLVLSDLGASGRDVTLDRTSGTGKIVNDDAAQVFVSNATVAEGNAGDANVLEFTVRLDRAVDVPVTVQFATGDSTADRQDYVPQSGNITFAAGERTATVQVQVRGDANVEPDERMRLVLSNLRAGNRAVSFGRTEGFGTISNDDGAAAGLDRMFAAGLADTLV